MDDGGGIPQYQGRSWLFDSRLWSILSAWHKLVGWSTASCALALAYWPSISKKQNKTKWEHTQFITNERWSLVEIGPKDTWTLQSILPICNSMGTARYKVQVITLFPNGSLMAMWMFITTTKGRERVKMIIAHLWIRVRGGSGINSELELRWIKNQFINMLYFYYYSLYKYYGTNPTMPY